MTDYTIKSEFVTLDSIPARAPLLRKSKWDAHLNRVFQAPPGHVLRVPFAKSIEGRRERTSLLVAAKRRGLKHLTRGSDLYLSTIPIPAGILNKTAPAAK